MGPHYVITIYRNLIQHQEMLLRIVSCSDVKGIFGVDSIGCPCSAICQPKSEHYALHSARSRQ
jgi:hypothetical protein